MTPGSTPSMSYSNTASSLVSEGGEDQSYGHGHGGGGGAAGSSSHQFDNSSGKSGLGQFSLSGLQGGARRAPF